MLILLAASIVALVILTLAWIVLAFDALRSHGRHGARGVELAADYRLTP